MYALKPSFIFRSVKEGQIVQAAFNASRLHFSKLNIVSSISRKIALYIVQLPYKIKTIRLMAVHGCKSQMAIFQL